MRVITPLSFLVIVMLVTIIGAQDAKSIQRRIEEERQIEKVKNEIMKQVGSVAGGALVVPQVDLPQSPAEDRTPVLIQTPRPDVSPTPGPMISVGEFTGSKKDGCLVFKIGKYVKDVEAIYPVRVDLWVNIQFRKKNKNKNKKEVTSEFNEEANDSKRTLREGRQRKQRVKKKNRKRRKRSRNIKIVVTDGAKRLAKLRMRVNKTMWTKIELPISKFPSVIKPNHNFTLCVVCRRCNKNVKLILTSKQMPRDSKPAQPRIPFIHIDSQPDLPLSYSRHN